MTAEDDALKQNRSTLTLKGRVTVRFIEGHSLDGELVAQDRWNIFVKVDNQPVMIPRSQVLYIKGQPGQQIEPDTSQEILAKSKSVGEAVDPSLFETADFGKSSKEEAAEQLEISPVDEDRAGEAGTVVVEPDELELPPDFTPDPVDDLEDTGKTYLLEEIAERSTPAGETGQARFVSSDLDSDEADWRDATAVLDEDEEDENEITFVLDSEAEPGRPAELICTAGPHTGEHFPLTKETSQLGRARDNDIPLSQDKEISRRHAVIKHEAGKYIIQDQNSLNGTFVNNERIAGPQTLKNGDIILVGVSDLEFRE